MNFADLKYNETHFYLVCRGTKSKSSLIAEKFNLQDKYSTHLGIGIIEEGLKIYSITDKRNTIESALLVEDVKHYLHDNVYYFSVWECSNT